MAFMVFWFIQWFVDFVTDLHGVSATVLNRKYSEIVLELNLDEYDERMRLEKMMEVSLDVEGLNELNMKIF